MMHTEDGVRRMTRTQRRRDTPNPTRDGKHHPVCIDPIKCLICKDTVCPICEVTYNSKTFSRCPDCELRNYGN